MLANESELGIFSEEADDQFRWMEDLGIEWQGKRILCISTAPGVFAAKAAKSADVVVTEYSPGVVDAMSKHLGLNAVLYDFNSDELEDVVDGKFDLIFALGIVNWCADQRSFIQSMTKVLNPNGVFSSKTIHHLLVTYFHGNLWMAWRTSGYKTKRFSASSISPALQAGRQIQQQI